MLFRSAATPAPTTTRAATPAPTTAPATTVAKGAVVVEPTHEIPESVDPLLVNILSWPRRHDSFQEMQFCKWLREHISSLGYTPTIRGAGNIIVTVPRPPTSKIVKNETIEVAQGRSTTLFSCHVDTIDGYDHAPPTWNAKTPAPAPAPKPDGEPQLLRKKLTYDPNFGLIALDKDSIGGSLGADDGAGVWLMLRMIERKVPGMYVFHRGEEVGGLGSKELAEKHKDLLRGYESAVAFDRKDTFEVVYQQGGIKCASMKFTEALCKRLTDQGMRYEPSDGGTFTDTKNYRRIIAECVNVAVGYESNHGRNETLDYAHLNALLDACCAIDWDSLPIDRDPAEADLYSYGNSYGAYRGVSPSLWDDSDSLGWNMPKKGKKNKQGKAPALTRAPAPSAPKLSIYDELSGLSLEELVDWAESEPYDVAETMGRLLVECRKLQAMNDTLMDLMGWKDLP